MELSTAFQEAGKSFYATAQSESAAPESGEPQPGAPTEEAKAEDVVEADFEIVDDSKK